MALVAEDADGTMLQATVDFRVQPHKRAEVLSAVDDTLRRMREAPGCTRTRLLADADDPNAFAVLSEWESALSADRFFNSREFRMFRGLRMLLRGEPVIVFDEIQSRSTRPLAAP
jgi:quinol monooxygenase YgiN